MTARRAMAAAVLIVGTAAAVSADEDLRITPVVTDGRVLVSVVARDSWTLGMREVLQAGQQIRFEYEIELKRPAPFWFFDSTLARTRVNSIARLDTLTGAYLLTRLRDDRVVRSERRSEEADVREWLTTIEQIELDPVTPLEPNQEYYVRVRMNRSPRRNVSLWWIWPFGRDDGSGRADFTFIR